MPSLVAIRDRLPTVYRPQAGDTGLFSRLLRAAAQALDDIDACASDVMQAHWFALADRALFSAYFRRARALEGKPDIALDDSALALFPYIADLARLSALLGLSPWREPPASREVTEGYRQRIRRIVAIYANGLGTIPALRGMIEAQLPVDMTAVPSLRDRPFALEEFSPLAVAAQQVQGRGAPLDKVGPLMRWSVRNDGLGPAALTLYIEGVASETDKIDATEDPLIELFARGPERVRLGLAYQGKLAPGQTLRLRPAYASWLGGQDGLFQAQSAPAAEAAADPTAAGPWSKPSGVPAGVVRATVQSRESLLWVVVENAGATELWRFDGTTWSQALGGLPGVHCLARDGDALLVGTAKGLLRVVLYPAGGGEPQAIPAVNQLDSTAVHALYAARDGTWWSGTAKGVAKLGASDTLTPFVLGADAAAEVPVYAVHQDRTGTLYFGCELGLFQFQPFTGHWYWYSGKDNSDQVPDWVRMTPDRPPPQRRFPVVAEVFLPPVRSLLRGPDASLWIGTDKGIARYVGHPVSGLAYTTLLEAFPDIATGAVHCIVEDERGSVWFACERGAFRFDGRDWWQVQGGQLVRLGVSAAPVAHWRFNRTSARWESAQRRAGASAWTPFSGDARGTAEPAVHAVLWTDAVVADLGSFDGSTFAADASATPGALSVRFKPSEIRIVDGGLPALPRLPAGSSAWRYLRREPGSLPPPKTLPAWTVEGRLLPPPDDQVSAQEGRFGVEPTLELSDFDEAVYAYNPAARVWFSWEPRRSLSVLARLVSAPGEAVEPEVIDRVWQGIEQVRPAGVRALLAVNEQIVRGK